MAASTGNPRISVKEPAAIAMQYLHDLIPAIAPDDISLEEIEMGQNEWLVTLGFTEFRSRTITFPGLPPARSYKQFRVDSRSGAVTSMRIRKP